MTSPQKKNQIEAMIEGGKKLGEIRRELVEYVKPGVTPIDIDRLADRLIVEAGGEASFKKVKDYKWATCINVNDTIVHGIPDERPLQNGDIVGIDVGIWYKGFHTDTGETILVGDAKDAETERFLRIGREALEKAIPFAKIGNRIGQISRALQEVIEGGGYHVVKSLVGHGVGKDLHESPEIPGFLQKPIEKTPLLQEGMTIAIEIIYTKGKPEMVTKADGWTLVTRDHSLSAFFEHSVLIGEDPQILTA